MRAMARRATNMYAWRRLPGTRSASPVLFLYQSETYRLTASGPSAKKEQQSEECGNEHNAPFDQGGRNQDPSGAFPV